MLSAPATCSRVGGINLIFKRKEVIVMKKFIVALFVLSAFAFTVLPIKTTHASIQMVECSWWGKMVNGDYDKGEEGMRRRLEQQRRQLEQQRRQLERQRRQQQRGY